jgi:hypothetical protein
MTMRIRIDYADQAESFRTAFPVFGEIGTQLAASAGEHSWYLVNLERPFQLGVNEYDRLLIASRWAGRTVREPGTSVFVLGVRRESPNPSDGFNPRAYDWLIWGTVDAAPQPAVPQ